MKVIKRIIKGFKRLYGRFRRVENVKKFTADFETCVWCEDETWVWAWATCEIGNEENIKIDNNIDSFMEFCKQEKNATFYFHNLKFDR